MRLAPRQIVFSLTPTWSRGCFGFRTRRPWRGCLGRLVPRATTSTTTYRFVIHPHVIHLVAIADSTISPRAVPSLSPRHVCFHSRPRWHSIGRRARLLHSTSASHVRIGHIFPATYDISTWLLNLGRIPPNGRSIVILWHLSFLGRRGMLIPARWFHFFRGYISTPLRRGFVLRPRPVRWCSRCHTHVVGNRGSNTGHSHALGWSHFTPSSRSSLH